MIPLKCKLASLYSARKSRRTDANRKLSSQHTIPGKEDDLDLSIKDSLLRISKNSRSDNLTNTNSSTPAEIQTSSFIYTISESTYV